mgnify:FL=1|tara:strand:- start:379 stop:951 length:573 start_codon:yes stop_codon:yes gene_type:complete
MSYAVAISQFSKSKGGKATIKILVGALVLLVAYLVLKKVFEGIGEGFGNFFDSRTLRQVVDGTPTLDGTEMVGSFKPQAKQIADQCEDAMAFSWGGNWTTDEKALFATIIDLNGAQLKQVYEQFGIRGGDDLFTWYKEDLGDSLIYMSNPTNWGITEEQLTAHMGERTGNIRERQLMANIWEKSGLITGL